MTLLFIVPPRLNVSRYAAPLGHFKSAKEFYSSAFKFYQGNKKDVSIGMRWFLRLIYSIFLRWFTVRVASLSVPVFCNFSSDPVFCLKEGFTLWARNLRFSLKLFDLCSRILRGGQTLYPAGGNENNPVLNRSYGSLVGF